MKSIVLSEEEVGALDNAIDAIRSTIAGHGECVKCPEIWNPILNTLQKFLDRATSEEE